MAKIKICGLFRDRDIGFVNEALPDYAGFVLCFPKSHRCVTLEEGIRLRSKLSPSVRAVGVFVDQDIKTVASYADAMKLDVIQLHGHEDNAYIEKLRANAACQVWKAFVIRTAEDLTEARNSVDNVFSVSLDSVPSPIYLNTGSSVFPSFKVIFASVTNEPSLF